MTSSVDPLTNAVALRVAFTRLVPDKIPEALTVLIDEWPTGARGVFELLLRMATQDALLGRSKVAASVVKAVEAVADGDHIQERADSRTLVGMPGALTEYVATFLAAKDISRAASASWMMVLLSRTPRARRSMHLTSVDRVVRLLRAPHAWFPCQHTERIDVSESGTSPSALAGALPSNNKVAVLTLGDVKQVDVADRKAWRRFPALQQLHVGAVHLRSPYIEVRQLRDDFGHSSLEKLVLRRSGTRTHSVVTDSELEWARAWRPMHLVVSKGLNLCQHISPPLALEKLTVSVSDILQWTPVLQVADTVRVEVPDSCVYGGGAFCATRPAYSVLRAVASTGARLLILSLPCGYCEAARTRGELFWVPGLPDTWIVGDRLSVELELRRSRPGVLARVAVWVLQKTMLDVEETHRVRVSVDAADAAASPQDWLKALLAGKATLRVRY